MLVAIDAIGIRGHGGAAVLCELLHWFPLVRPSWRFHVFLLEKDLCEFELPDELPGVTVTYTREGDKRVERMAWVNQGFPEKVKALKADVVFCFANIGARQPSTPQVVFCQFPGAFYKDFVPFWKIHARLRLAYMKQQIHRGFIASRAVVVQTKDMRDRIIHDFRLKPEEKIHIIPSGCRTPAKNPIIREKIKQQIQGTSHPRLIFISFPWKHKNFINLILALPEIIRHFPQASLLLTLDENEKSEYFANEIVKIRAAAQQAGVEKNIVMLGVLPGDEVDYALAQSDMLVFPSMAESFGLGIVEAMAAHIPVAIADLPYARDVAGDAACYFDPKNPAAIAASVVALLQDKEKMEELREMGELQRQQYDYQIIAEKIARVFEDAVRK